MSLRQLSPRQFIHIVYYKGEISQSLLHSRRAHGHTVLVIWFPWKQKGEAMSGLEKAWGAILNYCRTGVRFLLLAGTTTPDEL